MRLDQLGIKYGTDKNSKHHNYLDIYESWIGKYRNENIVLVDAVGGYEFKDKGGESLRMWADFLPLSKIIGIDLYEKEINVQKNVKLYKCSQDNEEGLKNIFETEGLPTVFIDDFSHINELTIKTFEICFPLVKHGGIYIVEDIEGFAYTDYGYGGTTDYNDMNYPHILNYFRKILNDLNAKYIANYHQTEIGSMIQSIHFYTNTIIIQKK